MVNESLAIGDTVRAKVVDIKKFGAFVELENKEEGFVHISKISKKYVKEISDFLSVGQEVEGKIIGKTKDGKYELSLKENSDELVDESVNNTQNFEKKLSQYLKESDKKISEYRKHLDKKRNIRKR
ncbi:MAG TPA: S1 RNA-binding domain-containing protein [Defluviitoga sp.]|nr:S1 RNA-binding domain-containing protein [Defluviitoga sp.]HOP25420.1 S1 RNA-binding domain-containing protein [Defluviitoga sp.]HPZ28287.1 S1 RNA-binding domain-containing protein [Defluviitoga sp.]HQD62177.1 S1 RNA-binding domain-containing protein [Defluviitoga sp.]